jgi:hypothetical protein
LSLERSTSVRARTARYRPWLAECWCGGGVLAG